jgi:ribonuclease G
MAKELIISANVHEKKVAILEDGVVTEFYVERRDENQGVVGNLYKGRVMKVLPGMQSAFVDIGLDRDAFLYVSDFTEFMEDEEEIDFREPAEEAKPSRPETRPRRPEHPRPAPAASSQPAAAPATERAPERPVRIEDAVEQLAEIADESVIPPPVPDEEPVESLDQPAEARVAPIEEFLTERITDDQFEAVRDEDLKGPGEMQKGATAQVASPAEQVAVEAEEAATEKPRRRGRKKPAAAEAEETTTASKKRGAKSKEKEPAAAKSAKGKGAAKAPAKKGRRRGETSADVSQSAEAMSAAHFERVTDEDLQQEIGELIKDAIVQEKIIEQVHEAEYRTSPVHTEPEPEWRVGSFRSQLAGGAGFERVSDEAAEALVEERGEISEAIPAEISESGEEAASSFRHISEFIPEALSSAGTGGDLEEDRQGEAAQSEKQLSEAQNEYTAAGQSEEPSAGAEEDAEAEIRDRGARADFAIRRGGRGRRRRPAGPPSGQPAPAQEEGKPAPQAAAAAPEEGEGNGADTPRRAFTPARRPQRGGPPTISELLHEGQEILVQIAKEPIAKKGARITSHIALPGRYLVYMPTVNHVGVSRKIPNEMERVRLKRIVSALREREGGTGGFIARTACAGHTEQELQDDMRYLLRTWADVKKKGERMKAPAMVHRDLDLVQRILRDQLSEEFTAIRLDHEVEYARIVEFVNRIQPKLVKRVKLYTGSQPILEKYGVQPEIDKAVRPRVWLKSGGYIVINQTEALVAIDVNTGKFVGKSDKLEDTITKTNLEAAKEIVRQVRLRDLGGIIVIDFIDMEERKNRQKVMTALQQELTTDRAPSKILSINDFGLVAITRKRVKQSLERTLCSPCPYCQGAGMVKSAQTVCFEILEQAKGMSKEMTGSEEVMLRVSLHVAEALRSTERAVLEEIEAYFGTPVTIEPDPILHQEQFDFAMT